MVFGNRGRLSATGVLFTRNPATGEPVLYGDVMFNAQGEDVVAGTHRTQPLSALDERMPSVAADLRHYSDVLEHHFADLCDIEFTIERGTLWLLQVRVGKRSPRAALRIAIDMASDANFPCSRANAVRRTLDHLADPPRIFRRADAAVASLTVGLGASPGIAAGEIVTTPEAAEAAAKAGRAVILVRHETSPEDVRGIARSAGVLTARGGLASHAAVVARGWGIPAVVGAHDVKIEGDRVVIGGRAWRAARVSPSMGTRARSSRATSPARGPSCRRPPRSCSGPRSWGSTCPDPSERPVRDPGSWRRGSRFAEWIPGSRAPP